MGSGLVKDDSARQANEPTIRTGYDEDEYASPIDKNKSEVSDGLYKNHNKKLSVIKEQLSENDYSIRKVTA